jgi:hypothetical protein
MEHVTKLPLVATGPREALTIGFSERADHKIESGFDPKQRTGSYIGS